MGGDRCGLSGGGGVVKAGLDGDVEVCQVGTGELIRISIKVILTYLIYGVLKFRIDIQIRKLSLYSFCIEQNCFDIRVIV